jgi:hypothetical protein
VAALSPWIYSSGLHRLRAIVSVAPLAYATEYVVGQIRSDDGPMASLWWHLGAVGLHVWRRPDAEPSRCLIGAASPERRFCFHLSIDRDGALGATVDVGGKMRGYATEVDARWRDVPLHFWTPDDDPAVSFSEISIREDADA